MGKPTFLTPNEKSYAWFNLKYWGFFWLGCAALHVAGGHSLLEALWRQGFLLIFGLMQVVWHLAVPRIAWLGRCQKLIDLFLARVSALNLAQMEAWSAKAVVTLFAAFGLIALVITSSSGWMAMAIGVVVSIVVAIVFWILMSWTDGLQARSKTQGQRVLGAFKLLFVLGVAWLGFIGILIWFIGKYT